MKRYIKDTESEKIVEHFSIVIEFEFPDDMQIAASTFKGFKIPDGTLLPPDKDAIIDEQALQNYYDFIDSVEALLTDYYDLEIYYKNESPDHSFYYGILAKSEDGSLLFDFDLTIRVATHKAHRTTQSKKHKNEQKEKLKQATRGKKTKPMFKSIIVNDNQFKTYDEAFRFIDAEVESKVNIMRSNK